MSFASYRPSAAILGMGPALLLLAGCSGGTPASTAPQAAVPPAEASASRAVAAAPSSQPAPTAPTYDRYANPAPTAPGPKPAVDFDGDAFRSASADNSVVGDRYSR